MVQAHDYVNVYFTNVNVYIDRVYVYSR